MQDINKFQVKIDGVDYTEKTVFPIKWSNLLDERLDETRISMKNLNKNIFHPLTPATITMRDSQGTQKTINAVVTTDEATENPVGSGLFDHEIMLLEETKILEGIVVDALAFTNDLGRNYTKNQITVEPQYQLGSKDSVFAPTISPYQKPQQSEIQFTFPGTYDLFGRNSTPIQSNYMRVLRNKEQIYKSTDTQKNMFGQNICGTTPYTTNLKAGYYRVEYYVSPDATVGDTMLYYEFWAVKNYLPLPRWNIATVIDRVLELAETHLEGVQPRFELNGKPKNGEAASGQYAEFEQIEAPEFAFTNSTLKEILDQIGGYIHGIPRLKGNTIYFDMLGGTKQAKIADPKYSYISNMYSQDVESYCTSLDSTVDNFVCLTDREQGAISDPYIYGGKSLRTETVYARVEEDNGFISTEYPIQEIVSVVCDNIPGNSGTAVDITPYVFEASEYARMSSYTEDYPYAKAYALYYTQGQQNIYGLFFKVPDVIGDVLKRYSITNIINAATGANNGDYKPYQKLAFRVTYMPVFAARIQQTKQYISDYKQPRALVYNQGANVIETHHFGENMKGAVARMGNVDRIVTYNLGDFSLIPAMGEMYGDDYYISGVACELYPNHIKCMLTLSQDFNRLSQYIGINSVRRFYEVSEKQAYRRDIKYADYLVIGNEEIQDTTLINGYFLMECFHVGNKTSEFTSERNASAVIAQGYDADDSPLTKVCLPVVTTAYGNAMSVTFSYEDNYSAGNMVDYQSEYGTSGYFTSAVPYGDYYGRLEKLKFGFVKYMNGETDLAEKLPLTTQSISPTIVSTGDSALTVKKDGAEILSINYTLDIVANRKNIIIGSGFAQNFGLVKELEIAVKNAPTLYILPTRIGKFEEKIDLSNATAVWNFRGDRSGANTHVTRNGKSLKFDNFTASTDGAAWAIANPQGELYFGANELITAGQTVNMPYITLRHNIFNL